MIILHFDKIQCYILIEYTFSVLILATFRLLWLLVGESRSLLRFYEQDKLVNGSFQYVWIHYLLTLPLTVLDPDHRDGLPLL